MGGAVSTGEDNDHLVDNLKDAEYIKSKHVEEVFRAVDRGHYYLEDHKDNAYKDLAWKHGNIHLSAPCIYSEVMESLQLKPGLSFLNLGSGTGYLSTMVGLVLGENGINHGVEIHDNVIAYAQEKLASFITQSENFDKFEFCEPKFVHGNCLLLPSGTRQYDRVYCGAACPPEHQNYMKNLIKVGGILVMPLDDQLLQFTRKDENSWDSKSALPVSFASLVNPSQEQQGILATVDLPSVNPKSLQENCRFKIRAIIREIVFKKHPPKTPPKVQRNNRHSRNCITIRNMSNMIELAGELMNEFNEDDENEEPPSRQSRRTVSESAVPEREDPPEDPKPPGNGQNKGNGAKNGGRKGNGKRDNGSGESSSSRITINRRRNAKSESDANLKMVKSTHEEREPQARAEAARHVQEPQDMEAVEESEQQRQEQNEENNGESLEQHDAARDRMVNCFAEAMLIARSLKRAYENGFPQDRKRLNDRLSESEMDIDNDTHDANLEGTSSAAIEAAASSTAQAASPNEGACHSNKINDELEHEIEESNELTRDNNSKQRSTLSTINPEIQIHEDIEDYTISDNDDDNDDNDDNDAQDDEEDSRSSITSGSSCSSSGDLTDIGIFEDFKVKRLQTTKRCVTKPPPLPRETNYMREYILDLPLPQSLVQYLLFYRQM